MNIKEVEGKYNGQKLVGVKKRVVLMISDVVSCLRSTWKYLELRSLILMAIQKREDRPWEGRN